MQAPAAAATAHPKPGSTAAGRVAGAGGAVPSSPAPSAGAPAAAAPAAKPTPEGPGSDSDAEQAGQAALELAERFRDAVVRGERLSRAVQLAPQPPALHHGRHVPSQLGWLASGALTSCLLKQRLAGRRLPAPTGQEIGLDASHSSCRGQGNHGWGGAVCAVGRRDQRQGANLNVSASRRRRSPPASLALRRPFGQPARSDAQLCARVLGACPRLVPCTLLFLLCCHRNLSCSSSSWQAAQKLCPC